MNERTVRVAIVIQKEDGHGTVAKTHCTQEEIKNLSVKDFLDRIMAPISAMALSEFKEKYFKAGTALRPEDINKGKLSA